MGWALDYFSRGLQQEFLNFRRSYPVVRILKNSCWVTSDLKVLCKGAMLHKMLFPIWAGAGLNLKLRMRVRFGVGTPREAASRPYWCILMRIEVIVT